MSEIKLHDLKSKTPTELLAFAEAHEVENASIMRKQELMFACLKQLSAKETDIIGEGVDVVLDCTAGAGTLPILLGIEALKRKAGVMVVQGEMTDFPNFPIGRMTVKYITLKSARGHSYRACELALEQIASKRFPLEKITTHRFGLNDVDLAIRSVGGKGVPDVIHASLMPWL